MAVLNVVCYMVDKSLARRVEEFYTHSHKRKHDLCLVQTTCIHLLHTYTRTKGL